MTRSSVSTISSVPGWGAPSRVQRFQGLRFIMESAKNVLASRSSGNWRATSRIAFAYAWSSASRLAWGSAEWRLATAPIIARSAGLAPAARAWACFTAVSAFVSRSASVGWL